MSMIQIRNVPDQLHRELKSRAALNGMTLSDYLLGELRALATRPTMQEWLAESETWEPVETDLSSVEALALERAEGAE
jgi:antitoxin FitA